VTHCQQHSSRLGVISVALMVAVQRSNLFCHSVQLPYEAFLLKWSRLLQAAALATNGSKNIQTISSFSALTPLVGRQEGQTACKKLGAALLVVTI